jgi:rhamnulokinase
MGVEAEAPVASEKARFAGVTNERGVAGTFRIQRNLAGLWPLQACLRRWRAQGHDLDWDDVVARAEAAPPNGPLVDLNDRVFLAPPDMEDALRSWCRERGQPEPDGVGAVARCCLESLALAYRRSLRAMEEVVGHRIESLRVVGGGARNELLAQWTADACGVPVLAGPVEATALGNLLVQALATGAVPDLETGRAAIAAGTARRSFAPRSGTGWDAREAHVASLDGWASS